MDQGLSSATVCFRIFGYDQAFTDIMSIRDIPLPLVTSGCENSGNLRELALNRMKDFGAECRDVRFREVGVSMNNGNLSFNRESLFLTRRYHIDSRNSS